MSNLRPLKRRKVPIAHDIDLSSRNSANYLCKVTKRDGNRDLSAAFMTAETRSALAVLHHGQILLQGFTMLDVHILLDWAAEPLEHHKVLLKMALFDGAYGLRLANKSTGWALLQWHAMAIHH